MSNYRDDSNDTAIASDHVWTGLSTIAESTARISSVIFSSLALLLADSAVASDEIAAGLNAHIVESATASDTLLQSFTALNFVQDGARAQDTILGRLRQLVADEAHAEDTVLDALHSVVADAATVSDSVADARSSRVLTAEQVRVDDRLITRQASLVVDSGAAGDTVHDAVRLRSLVVDSAKVQDELSASNTQSMVVTDSVTATNVVIDLLHARGVLADSAWAQDELVSTGAVIGQVWTAQAGEWAMSRWALGLTGLAVVDGVLYATTPNGVFALDGDGETITAELRTGAIDMTGGQLSYPFAAYLEYELAGVPVAASVGVTTTQSGAAQHYKYPVQLRPVAGALTNARALLGRGLRGRHFAYTLTLTGGRGYINDWSVLTTSFARRI